MAMAGFTLVELVVTLVIIGALAAIAGPAFFTKNDFEQSGFANEVLATVRYAQKLAVSSGCTVRVTTTATTVSVLHAATTATCTTGPFTTAVPDPSNPGNAFVRTAPSGTTMTAGIDITFVPLGNAPAMATATQDIVVGGRTLRVWRATGSVERV